MLNLSGDMLVTLLVVAMLTEVLVEILKAGIPFIRKVDSSFEVSLFVGMILCLVFEVTIFNVVANTVTFYISCLLTGLIISRGSNFIHDMFDKLRGIRK